MKRISGVCLFLAASCSGVDEADLFPCDRDSDCPDGRSCEDGACREDEEAQGGEGEGEGREGEGGAVEGEGEGPDAAGAERRGAFCDRRCNCLDDVTDECMGECADELDLVSAVPNERCIECLRSTACEEIADECRGSCGLLASLFPAPEEEQQPTGGCDGSGDRCCDQGDPCRLSYNYRCECEACFWDEYDCFDGGESEYEDDYGDDYGEGESEYEDDYGEESEYEDDYGESESEGEYGDDYVGWADAAVAPDAGVPGGR